jgi:hypothetical protein
MVKRRILTPIKYSDPMKNGRADDYFGGENSSFMLRVCRSNGSDIVTATPSYN